MTPISLLFCWQFVLFSLAIAGITYPLRLFIEFYISSSRVMRFWKDVALPTFPIFLGAIMGRIIVMFPFPVEVSLTEARVFWGLVAGMFSSIMFRITKVMLFSMFGATENSREYSEKTRQ